ncbi:SH3 domain-containing protein [Spirulina major CS-329]|jgi:hypothetical protein|uniref:SH3 domain-containing protein n=1 Tax=Spirulina TaxID=1154 RepID=UPI00232AE80F|nr:MULTISPECIES: SH3 domain-containing protein [Spirulina]MDB9493605.1 SH3 domain-containing protein [Spirulina subsalsa CS-330]MDB9504622.1 SH3 domain-containing protein [Spirulina major CS-329]
MSFLRFLQFVLGIICGVALLGISGAAAGYYFFSRMSVNPERPIYSEERGSTATAEPQPTDGIVPETAAEAQSDPDAAPEPAEPVEELEEGAYRAQVTWPDGLTLRAEPSLDAEQIGSLLYEDPMIVLDTTDDGLWERVRMPGSDRQGWVKAGNSEPIEED